MVKQMAFADDLLLEERLHDNGGRACILQPFDLVQTFRER